MRLHSQWAHKKTRLIVELLMEDDTRVFFIQKYKIGCHIESMKIEAFKAVYEPIVNGGMK